MLRKVISTALACIMCTSLLCFSASAAEVGSSGSDDGNGTIVSFNLIEVTPNGVATRSSDSIADQDYVIAYMEAQGWTPGSTFYVGNKEYKVLDDYQILYVGVDEDMVIDHTTDEGVATRATTIPTKQGTLPYNSTYSILNYMYTSYYWKVGSTGEVGSIGVRVSPDSTQTVRVDWIDGRNDESMGSKTYTLRTNNIYQYVWVCGGEKFYLTLTNEGDYGEKKITGAFDLFLDQLDIDW